MAVREDGTSKMFSSVAVAVVTALAGVIGGAALPSASGTSTADDVTQVRHEVERVHDDVTQIRAAVDALAVQVIKLSDRSANPAPVSR